MKIIRGTLAATLLLAATLAHSASYQYLRIGNKNALATKPTAGIAMMGGGSDLDEAFRWLCDKGNGGDFLILRATGDDDYNSYIQKLCHMNSVATLIIPDRQAAQDPAVAEIIRRAAVIFIAGGDQANYIRGWRDTPVESAINANVAAGKAIGGTSAGLGTRRICLRSTRRQTRRQRLGFDRCIAQSLLRACNAGSRISNDPASGEPADRFALCQA